MSKENRNKSKVAVIIPGGGMRNSFVSGVLEGLDLDPAEVGAIYTQSSGGPTACYFATGQGSATKNIWVKKLTSGRVMGLRALLMTGRPGDVDYLIDVCCKDLRLDKLEGATPRVSVSTVRVYDGKEEYHTLNDAGIYKAQKLLKATCALPALVRPVWLGGEAHIDGGVHTLIPIQRVRQDGYQKMVILLNRPVYLKHTNKMRMIDKLIFPTNEEVRLSFHERAVLYNDAIDELKIMEKKGLAYIIGPEEKLGIERLSRSRRKVKKTFELGKAVGKKHKQALNKFLD